jgi:putative tricarboxylic transport membrane protein
MGMKKINLYKDIILGIAVSILAAAYFIGSFFIELRVLSTGITAATIPRLLGVCEFVLGILLAMRGIFSYRLYIRTQQFKDEEKEKPEKQNFSAVLETSVLLIFYVVAFKPLGFIVSSMIFMFLEMIVVCPSNEKRDYRLFAIVSAATAFIVYFLFRYGFDQMLPTGIMEFLEYII